MKKIIKQVWNNQKGFKGKTGITLIALVITIIVLLILAGVSIATLTGENGILTRANEAKVETDKAEFVEQLQLALLGARTNKDNVINLEDLENNINNIGEGIIINKVGENGNLPWEVTYKEYKYQIDEDGNETEIETETEVQGAPIGDYVEYIVSYVDMYTNYQFTASNGWRILDGGVPNGDGTYSGVKLVSTGIPAKLHYNYSTGTDGQAMAENNKPDWWGTDEQVSSLYGEEYSNGGYIYENNGYPSNYAAAGLFKNFVSIVFEQKSSGLKANGGGYIKINEKTSGELAGTEFLANGAVEVHNLTLEELNDARNYSEESLSNISESAGDTGLFYLRGLENENPDYGYNSEVYSYYWLASAYNSLGYNLRFVHANGDINRYYNTSNGVRPVVSLESKIYKDGDIWKIQ